jgi:hypothetical protein
MVGENSSCEVLGLLPNQLGHSCGLYYKSMTIVNDNSRVINKLETSLTDDARVIEPRTKLAPAELTSF